MTASSLVTEIILTSDSIRFVGDTIVSKAFRENTIVVWQIDGFDSNLIPPREAAHHITAKTPTGSSFGGKFERLHTLQMPGSGPGMLRHHFDILRSDVPAVVYGDLKGIYCWNLVHAGAKANWDPFDAVAAEDNMAMTKTIIPDAPWAWEEPVHVALSNDGMYMAIGMKEGRACLLRCVT
jgi:hypothetical protein